MTSFLSPNDSTLTPFLDRLAFPESPRWNDGALWFSDFYTQRVRRVDMKGYCETVVSVPGQSVHRLMA